ncbi:MAG: hypothetical protein NTW31_01570 [Bacteroidetes bacterium]|nr:hypothetical protein [Bacteroidota bacterium]
MTGVVVHMIIGFLLFTPLGFIVGMLQHRREQEKEEEDKKSLF